MRRRTLAGFVAAALLLVLVGAYTVFWFIVAGRIEDGIGEWAQSLKAQNLDLSWQAIRVGGFPLGFRVGLSEARLRNGSGALIGEVEMPLLSASTRPWDFRVWQLSAPNGLSAGEGSVATLKAGAATGSLAAGADGGATVWLSLSQPNADFGARLAAEEADLWLILPAHPPRTHAEPAIELAFDVRRLTVPVVPAPFLNPVDEVAVGATLLGSIPAGPLRQSAAAWRDAGGTLELDHVAARWGRLAITGSGTVALDPALQPEGAFSGRIEGYDDLMAALVAAGRMRAGDANLARLALTMLARAGPDGRPEIATSFTIQGGQMYLGPAKLGPVPRINW